MAEPRMIYKITILYMLDCSKYPLSDTLFADFFLGRDYTDYFQVQSTLHELQDTQMITAMDTPSNLHKVEYALTDTGRETLHVLRDKVTDEIAADVMHYLKEHEIAIRDEHSLPANYDRTVGGQYLVHCKAISGDVTMMDLTLRVPGLAQAQAICENWKNGSMEVYDYLMELLVK